jgi:HPt (histidine-containing phosphotransfer) domain-containing protein
MNRPQRHHKLDRLQQLLDGDAEALAQMVRVFRENTPQIVSELNEHFDKGDNTQLSRAAHKLKSSIDLFQIDELSASVREIETLSRNRDSMEYISPLIQRLNKVIEEVLEDLE